MRGFFFLRVLTLCIATSFGPNIATAASDEIAQASTLLSRFPAGKMADTDSVLNAIDQIGQFGTRREIGLLRQIIHWEVARLRTRALQSVYMIRERQVVNQRQAFRTALSMWDQNTQSHPHKPMTGPKELECVAYAQWFVDKAPTVIPAPQYGNAKLMLKQGRAEAALGAVINEKGHDARMLEGRIREELGDVYGAISVYASQFAQGHEDAGVHLESYGVHPERLLIGLMTTHTKEDHHADDTAILNVLVRKGTGLTVSVLAERLKHPTPSERSIAIDALARMLEPSLRQTPLTHSSQRAARLALKQASTNQSAPVRAIAIEALHQIP